MAKHSTKSTKSTKSPEPIKVASVGTVDEAVANTRRSVPLLQLFDVSHLVLFSRNGEVCETLRGRKHPKGSELKLFTVFGKHAYVIDGDAHEYYVFDDTLALDNGDGTYGVELFLWDAVTTEAPRPFVVTPLASVHV